ncbi:MAG: cytochrome P450 [Acidobacteria bacterium]|nr:cytochrome P450 [Acidobacteriota bacterium]
MSTAVTPPNSAIDFCDSALYDDPWDTYRELREHDPFHRDEINNLWVVSRHADVSHISRNPELYCNRLGVRPKGASDLSILAMDDPEHTRQRRIVNRGFTPRQVRNIIPRIHDVANQIIDEIGQRGEIDFVSDFAIHVPLIVIAEMLGLDPSQRDDLHRWSDAMMAGDGREDPDDPALAEAAIAFGEYTATVTELIEQRKANPTEDLISVLTQAFESGDLETLSEGGSEVHNSGMVDEVVGEKMDDTDLLMFLVTLLVAGNETTRNAITGGMHALSQFPAERQRLIENLDNQEFIDLAVDEIIRYVTPVLTFSRTVTTDHTYEGDGFSVELKEGDTVFMLYQSANRDETVFDRPDELILDRDPNPHLAFGIGTHYCLGANLARAEVGIVFNQLFQRLPDIVVPDGETPKRGISTLVLSLESLPAHFTPERMVEV